jgi:hypothetical protein
VLLHAMNAGRSIVTGLQSMSVFGLKRSERIAGKTRQLLCRTLKMLPVNHL